MLINQYVIKILTWKNNENTTFSVLYNVKRCFSTQVVIAYLCYVSYLPTIFFSEYTIFGWKPSTCTESADLL